MANNLRIAVVTLGFILAYPISVIASNGATSNSGILDFILNPLFQFTAFGAAVSHLFSPYPEKKKGKGLQLNKIFLDSLLSGGTGTLKAIIIFVLSIFIGGLLALILGAPSTSRAALIAGMGWTGLIAAGTGAAVRLSGGE